METKSGNKAHTTDTNEPEGVWLALDDVELADDIASTVNNPSMENKNKFAIMTSYASLVDTSNPATRITELYDSGAMQHMSPFRNHFIKYHTISPMPI